MKTRAMVAIFLCSRRLRLRPRGLSALRAIPSSRLKVPGLSASCAIPDPWVNDRVHDVDKDAHHYKGRAADEGYGHDHVVVAAIDRLKREPSNTRNARQCLDKE